MPTVEARRLCPDGVYLRGDMAKYSRESKRIFEIFRRFTPQVEGISLDEAFLDLTGSERLLGLAAQVGERLRSEVREETGLAVSVGIAPIKMVAKIASDAAKPDGLLEVEESRLREFLDPLPVGRIWGVGPVARARLEGAGLRTIGDLARADSRPLHRLLGDWGDHIARLARGVDLREVAPYREPVSISEENTFASDVSSREVLEAAILAHAEAVARRLRRSGYCARTVVLKLKLARRIGPGPRGYPLLTRRTTLNEPTDDGAVIASETKRLLANEKLPEAVRLLGVGVTNLDSAAVAQLALFGAGRKRERRSQLNRALDEIADRFGPRAVTKGGGAEVTRAGLSSQIKRGDED
jgi:DNA polymerase-4